MRRLPADDERRYLAGGVDLEREQVWLSRPQVDWLDEWNMSEASLRWRRLTVVLEACYEKVLQRGWGPVLMPRSQAEYLTFKP